MENGHSAEPLPQVSIIIPTFNAAQYLPRAIHSVRRQTYQNFELIVIDDGSTDDTRMIIEQLRSPDDQDLSLKYIHQQNRGLSAARNAGIAHSRGTYLVFLDADDWLEPDALQKNLAVIMGRPDLAFVSGNYYLLREGRINHEEIAVTVPDKHYTRLLESNYIGMHAAVMFQRWVLQHIQYDEALPACEDYDLYLRIARQYPVLHQQQFIATYYFHPGGLSHNHQLMMNAITTVMEKQRTSLLSSEEKAAYQKGLEQWKDYARLMNASI